TLGTITVGGVPNVDAVAMESRKGSVTPSLSDGRLPTSSDEIALGTETMQKAGVDMGSTVPVAGSAGEVPMRVVGQVAFQPLFFSQKGPGEGAALSLAGVDRLDRSHRPPDVGAYFVTLFPG